MIHLHQFLTSMFDHNFPCACITLEPAFLVLGLPLSSSNDLPSRLPSSPPPRYPTHHISTPSFLPSSAPVDLAGHLPNTGKFKPTHRNSRVHALLNSALFRMTRVLSQVTPDETSPTMRQHHGDRLPRLHDYASSIIAVPWA